MSPQICKIKRSSKLFQIKSGKLRHGKIHRLASKSHYLDNQRYLDVYLPPDYEHSQAHYPVLYMHDGNNLFFPEIAFGGVPWKVNKTLDLLISLKMIEPIILVGVFNTVGRNEEYTWSRMRTYHGGEGGQGPRYAHYLIEEVKPMIDHHYRTQPTAQKTAVMGSSLGGLISFYLGMYHSTVFAKLGLVSPSLWWNYQEPLRVARNFPIGGSHHNLKIWLDMGTREGSRQGRVDNNPNIRNTRNLKKILESRNYHNGYNLGYLEDRGAQHNEWWWGQRLHLPLIFFFGTPKGQRLIWK